MTNNESTTFRVGDTFHVVNDKHYPEQNGRFGEIVRIDKDRVTAYYLVGKPIDDGPSFRSFGQFSEDEVERVTASGTNNAFLDAVEDALTEGGDDDTTTVAKITRLVLIERRKQR